MHELGLVSAALAHALEVARQAGATRVERLTFAIAADGHVTREAVQTLVAALARGTIIEGATVRVEVAVDRVMQAELALTSIDVDVPVSTVNFLRPYATLKAPNVLGTQEVLRMACRTRLKPVHFVSSFYVFSRFEYLEGQILREDAIPAHGVSR